MKILYAEGTFLDMGHQILAYPASVGSDLAMDIEKEVVSTVPEVKQSIDNLFSTNPHYEVIPPQLGDVIWTQTSGSKWYAHCIVYDENGDFNYAALDLCVKSIKKKAVELGHDEIGMPLRWFADDVMPRNWNRVYPVIEAELSDDGDEVDGGNFQVYVYEPDSVFLELIMANLSGQMRAFYSEPVIRFRTS